MSTAADELNDLLRQQAEHEAAANEAAERAATYEAQMFAEQVARREEWCQEFADSYDARVKEIKDAQSAALRGFFAAVADDATIGAWVQLRAQHLRMIAVADQQANSLIHLGREGEVAKYRAPTYQEPRLVEDLLDVAEDLARDIADTERTAFDEEREAYAIQGERP